MKKNELKFGVILQGMPHKSIDKQRKKRIFKKFKNIV